MAGDQLTVQRTVTSVGVAVTSTKRPITRGSTE
jgi:hypothetical protein